jgi:hypothetical protein
LGAAGHALTAWHWPKIEVWFAVTAAFVSSISGYLSLRNVDDDRSPDVQARALSKLFKTLVHSDRATAILLLQMAVIYQSIAVIF